MKIEQVMLQPKMVPMAEQKPFGYVSKSNKWYEHMLLPREKFGQPKNVIVFAAHEDDETDFMGGTITALSQKGYAVTVVHMTDGRYGAMPEVTHEAVPSLVSKRLEESIEALKVLGVQKVINLGIDDGHVPGKDSVDWRKAVRMLVAVMRQESADVVFSHAHPANPLTYDGHPDHRNTALLVEEAQMWSAFHLYDPDLGEPLPTPPVVYSWDPQDLKGLYGNASYTKLPPVGVLVDITSTKQAKKDAFALYQSQIFNIDARKGFVSHVGRRSYEDNLRGGQLFSSAEGFSRYSPSLTPEDDPLGEMLGEKSVIMLPLFGEMDGPICPLRRSS